MGAVQDFVQWCITERERLYDQLEDFEATVVNVLALDDGAVISQTTSKIEHVKTRIAKLDCIVRRRKRGPSHMPNDLTSLNR